MIYISIIRRLSSNKRTIQSSFVNTVAKYSNRIQICLQVAHENYCVWHNIKLVPINMLHIHPDMPPPLTQHIRKCPIRRV